MQDPYESLWRGSAHEAVPYTDDFPECFLVLPEWMDGSISQGNSTSISIHISIENEIGRLVVIDNGKGVKGNNNEKRLLHWASKQSTTVHHRYGHGSKKCLTKWNANYHAPWYVRFRTCDKRGNSSSLFTYQGPFVGTEKEFEEDDEETHLMPSGMEWSIQFEKKTLSTKTTPSKIGNAIKEILRTRYSKQFFDRISFSICVQDSTETWRETSVPLNQWKTLQECMEEEFTKGNARKIKELGEPFNGITVHYIKYQLMNRSNELRKQFPTYGEKNMKSSRIHISLNGRTIEHMPYWKCLGKNAQHNSDNGIIGFIHFIGSDTDYEKMPTPCTTKVSFYENCEKFILFKQRFGTWEKEESNYSATDELVVEQKESIVKKEALVEAKESIVKKEALVEAKELIVKKEALVEAKESIVKQESQLEPKESIVKHKKKEARVEPEPIKLKSDQIKITDRNIRGLVWDTYIGESIIKHKCLCCKKRDIKNTDFHAGHVISKANGGHKTIDNLRPICTQCNLSMSKKNMKDYIIEHELYF